MRTMGPRLALACGLLTTAAPPPSLAADTPFNIAPIANIQYEWGQVDSSIGSIHSDHDFRRARLGFSIKGNSNHWQLLVDHDLTNNTPPDAFLLLTPSEGQSFRIGQFKQPFSLEDAIADKQSAFLEASPVGAFAISRRIGAEYARWGKWGTFNASVFGHRLDGTNHSPGVSMRGTWLLHSSKEQSAHIGFSLASESPRNNTGSFSLNAGTTMSSLKTVSTGSIAGVDRLDRFAIEGLWVRGPWSLQAEVAQVSLQRTLGNMHGSASDLQLTWSPTGDGRSHKRGVATAPTPKGHTGWELALRYGVIDLNSGPVHGGHTETRGLAATCYPHPNVRIIANLLQFNGSRMGIRNNPVTAGVRLQLTY